MDRWHPSSNVERSWCVPGDRAASNGSRMAQPSNFAETRGLRDDGGGGLPLVIRTCGCNWKLTEPPKLVF